MNRLCITAVLLLALGSAAQVQAGGTERERQYSGQRYGNQSYRDDRLYRRGGREHRDERLNHGDRDYRERDSRDYRENRTYRSEHYRRGEERRPDALGGPDGRPAEPYRGQTPYRR